MSCPPSEETPHPAGRLLCCARNSCRKVILLCSSCDRGNRYCSPDCSRAARQARQRAAGARYQRTRRGRLKHAARQARYRARRRMQQKVTHLCTQERSVPGNLRSLTDCTAVATEAPPHPAREEGEVTADTLRERPPPAGGCARCGRNQLLAGQGMHTADARAPLFVNAMGNSDGNSQMEGQARPSAASFRHGILENFREQSPLLAALAAPSGNSASDQSPADGWQHR